MTLREKRIEKGLSVKQLSEAVGVTDAFIRYLEYGSKEPSLKIARRISKILDSSIDELFGEKEDEHRQGKLLEA